MKFKTKTDEIQFKLLGLNEVEVRKRLKLSQYKAKDKSKSRDMKNAWRRNKHKLMKGIKKWNKSTAGKRFHRALGRFNALRESAVIGYNNDLQPGMNYVDISMDQAQDALLSLSSIETHLYLELQYYEPDPEAMMQFLEILHQFVQDTSVLKEELLDAYVEGKMESEDYTLLTDIIQFFQDPKMYVYAKRDLLGKSNDTDEEDFKEQVKAAESIDLSLPGNEIYETLDKLFVKYNKK